MNKRMIRRPFAPLCATARMAAVQLTAALLALALLLGPALPAVAASAGAGAQEAALAALLNEDRAKNGLKPYIVDSELCAIARIKSEDMLDNRYFSHTSPTYGRVKNMLTTFGVNYLSANENIARCRNVEHANASFLSSASHRRSMLSSVYTHVGIGVAIDANGFVIVTEIFVRR